MKSEIYRIKILLKLAYNDRLTFSELWDRKITSNRFSYHLKELQKDGLIKKTDEVYTITPKGEKLIAYLSEKGYRAKEQPILGAIIIVQKGNKILYSFRKKEPFKGYYGEPHGRISLGEGVEQAASRILKERTGLEGRLELKGLWIVNTIRNNKVFYSHYHFILKASAVKGVLKRDTKDVSNTWVPVSSSNKLERFYDDDYILGIVRSKGFTIMEANRFQTENGKFVGIKIKRKHEF